MMKNQALLKFENELEEIIKNDLPLTNQELKAINNELKSQMQINEDEQQMMQIYQTIKKKNEALQQEFINDYVVDFYYNYFKQKPKQNYFNHINDLLKLQTIVLQKLPQYKEKQLIVSDFIFQKIQDEQKDFESRNDKQQLDIQKKVQEQENIIKQLKIQNEKTEREKMVYNQKNEFLILENEDLTNKYYKQKDVNDILSKQIEQNAQNPLKQKISNNDQLEEDFQNLTKNYKQLEKKNQNLQNKISELDEKLKQSLQNNQKLFILNTTYQKDIQQITLKNNQLQQQLDLERQKVVKLEDNQQILQQNDSHTKKVEDQLQRQSLDLQEQKNKINDIQRDQVLNKIYQHVVALDQSKSQRQEINNHQSLKAMKNQFESNSSTSLNRLQEMKSNSLLKETKNLFQPEMLVNSKKSSMNLSNSLKQNKPLQMKSQSFDQTEQMNSLGLGDINQSIYVNTPTTRLKTQDNKSLLKSSNMQLNSNNVSNANLDDSQTQQRLQIQKLLDKRICSSKSLTSIQKLNVKNLIQKINLKSLISMEDNKIQLPKKNLKQQPYKI